MRKKYAVPVVLSMAVFMGIPASAGAQGYALDQPTGKLVITDVGCGRRSRIA
jgi:hypothetical protein